MKIILSVLLVVVLLASCTPEKRLARLVKNHPELMKIDTLWQDVPVYVPGVQKDTSTALNMDVSGVDSILQKYGLMIDSLTRRKLHTEIKNYVINRPVIKDTLNIFLTDSTHIQVFQDGNNLNWRIRRNPQTIYKTVPVVINSVTADVKKTFWDHVLDKWPEILLFGILFYLMLRKRG